jgi:hypothetical protein
MHDTSIEDRLRGTLRAEADALPFSITSDELERRLALRRRERAGRRTALLAAGLAAVIVGGGLVLTINPFRGTQVATTPRPSVIPSSLPSGPASGQPAVSPQPSPRDRGPLGSVGQAILVTPIGDGTHPTSFDVLRFDPVTGSTENVATVPGSILPEDGWIDGGEGAPMVSLDGYLAIPFTRGPNMDDSHPAIAVVDLRDPTSEAWILDGYLEPRWGRNDDLLIRSQGASIDFASAATREVVRRAALADDVTPVWWSATDDAAFVATRGDTWGAVDARGEFTALKDLPAVYQRTGRERPTGVANHTIGMGCDSGATGGACVLGEWDASDQPPIRTWFTASPDADPIDQVWASDGKSLFILLSQPKQGDRQPFELVYASKPTARTRVGTIELPVSSSPAILGIASGPTAGRPSTFAIGDRDGNVQAFILADGTVSLQDGTAWFAGWAGEPEPYDPD